MALALLLSKARAPSKSTTTRDAYRQRDQTSRRYQHLATVWSRHARSITDTLNTIRIGGDRPCGLGWD
jgi:hypothetical protein